MEVVPLWKVRVVDRYNTNNTAIVSVWRPSEDIIQTLKEGRSYHLYNVVAGGLRLGELQLNSMKNTIWEALKETNSDNQQVTKPVI